MPRRNEPPLVEILLRAPWKVNVLLGLLAFVTLRWLVPMFVGNNQFLQVFASLLSALAPVALFVFLLFAAVSFWFGCHRRSLVDVQTGLESLRALSWKQFEFMVAEAYQRQGYTVDYSMNKGADGGVDLTLRKSGIKSLVQCKQWKTQSVGVTVVREMFGLMHAEQAQEVIIVTTGGFTNDAQEFAAGKPIQLFTGPELLKLVKSVQAQQQVDAVDVSKLNQSLETPVCPLCGKPMVERTARRGTNVGKQFWGCSTYPACKGTRSF